MLVGAVKSFFLETQGWSFPGLKNKQGEKYTKEVYSKSKLLEALDAIKNNKQAYILLLMSCCIGLRSVEFNRIKFKDVQSEKGKKR